MRVLVQKSKYSEVEINKKIVGKITSGLVLFVGFTHSDSEKEIIKMINKILNLRIFDDENGIMNRSILEVGGEILSISQFTLYADCKKGNRPSFTNAGNPELANNLYEYIIEKCKEQIPNVQTGSFGADMKILLLNDGPFTIVLDSNEL